MTFTASYLEKKNIRRGFTLIELLVVISIIAFLSSVVIATTNTARAKARDAKKLSDAKQVSTAMEMWYSDNKTMPSSLNQLVPKYLSQVPDNFTYKVATSSGVAVAYTTYETKNTPSGADQQVGAVLVDDQSNANLCDPSLSLGFPACSSPDSNGNIVPLDQVVDVNNGEVASSGPTYIIRKLVKPTTCQLNETKINGVCECNPNETRVNNICICNDGYLANSNGMGCHLPCPPPPNGYATVITNPDGSCSVQQIGAPGD